MKTIESYVKGGRNVLLCIKRSLEFTTALSVFFSFSYVYATEVSSWSELGVALGADSDVEMTGDISTADDTTKQISILSNVTIDGQGHALIGSDDSHSLSITKRKNADPPTSVTMKNLGSHSDGTATDSTFSFKNLNDETVYKKITTSVNSFPDYFLTVWQPITLNVENSVFENNGASLLRLVKDQTLNIKNSIFYANNRTKDTAPIIGNTAANINIENSIFYGNSTKGDGGVLKNSASLTIKDSIFVNNTSGDDGGAISLTGSSTSTIEGSRFEGNTAVDGDGGAIALESNTHELTYIKNSKFINNKSGTYYDGGAISTMGGYVKELDGVLFEGNNAHIRGGGFWGAMASKHKEKDPVLLKDVVFKNNEAGSAGGMFTEGERDHYTYIVNTQFVDNLVKATNHYMWYSNPYGGGLMSAGGVPMVLNNVEFTNNNALPDGSNNYSAGGAIYFAGDGENYHIKLVDSTFTKNSALEGGALFVDNADANIIANSKDVTFSENTDSGSTETYNAGSDIYFQANEYGTLSMNAAEGKKVVFDGTVAAYTGTEDAAIMNINNSGITYSTYDGTTETPVAAGTSGEIQFNNWVGDKEGNIFNINLYGGKLSIGQNATNNANVDNPDGYINDNNFYVKGDSTLNTINGVIGEFAPNTFQIDAKMSYEFDIDLVNKKADMLKGAANNASVELSVLNIISDSDESNLKIVYSDKNVNGALKDGYSITTSSATYDITAENHDSGSYLMFAKDPTAMTGLPGAILNGSDVYSNTSGTDEVVEKWGENDLSADLVVNGNNHGFTTENNLDGINVDSDRTLTMNNVTDMSGFNYAVKNEGKVALHNTVISDDIINNGTLSINDGSSVGAISGTGTMNVNSDLALNGNISGNTVNVNNAKLSNLDKLGSDTTLNAVGGTIDLNNKQATVKSASFDENSTLALTVNSLSDHGSLTADTISVANGAQLKATLGQGILGNEKTATVQLLSAQNTDFNNFTDSFDNKMYHFEKADKNGAYTITQTNSAEDVVRKNGGQRWVGKAAKAYVDGPKFKEGTVGADVANKLAALAQNDAKGLISNMKALAPTESAIVQGQAIEDVNRLFKTVDGYLRGQREPMGMSAGDVLEGVSIWAKPYVGKSKLSRRGQIAGLTSDSKGLILGVEKKLNPEIKLGTGIQYDTTDIDMFRRDVDADTFVGYMYGEYKPNRWFANSILSYGYSDYDEYKRAFGKRYTAHYDVKVTSLASMTGYQFKYVTPEAGFRYYNIRRDSYTDSADQHVKGVNTNILRMVAGAHFVHEYGIFYPDVHVGVTYDVVSAKDDTIVRLGNNTTYRVEGKRLPRLGYELNVGVNAHVMEDLIIGLHYEGSYRKDYQEHTGMMTMKYDF